MPFPIDRQRARRWAVEPKPAPPVAPVNMFSDLRERGLVGISDQVLRDHLSLYEGYCAELAALDLADGDGWRQPSAVPPAEAQMLLAMSVRDLGLTIEGQLAEAVEQVEAELQAKGVTWRPLWYLGDSDFWTTDQAISINLPWFLANDALWALVNDQETRYTRDDVVRILRHELGHAIGYAFELWKEGIWKVTFGDFFQPYLDEYTPDPASTDFVQNLHDSPAAASAHYAQKHPDEDWAETFAVWLDPGSRWQETYAAWPGALRKLEVVQTLLVDWGRAYGLPINRRVGRTVPYQTLDYTVADYLGVRTGPDPADNARRRLPTVYNAVVLHESYFGGLARGAGVGVPAASRFGDLATMAYGSFDAWAADLRAAARASSGWALTVWDRRGARLRNVVVAGHEVGVPAGADLLLALDAWEHAYAGDDGIRKDVYVGAVFRNLAWGVIESRALLAAPPPPPVTLVLPVERPWPGLDLPPGATGAASGRVISVE